MTGENRDKNKTWRARGKKKGDAGRRERGGRKEGVLPASDHQSYRLQMFHSAKTRGQK